MDADAFAFQVIEQRGVLLAGLPDFHGQLLPALFVIGAAIGDFVLVDKEVLLLDDGMADVDFREVEHADRQAEHEENPKLDVLGRPF